MKSHQVHNYLSVVTNINKLNPTCNLFDFKSSCLTVTLHNITKKEKKLNKMFPVLLTLLKERYWFYSLN